MKNTIAKTIIQTFVANGITNMWFNVGDPVIPLAEAAAESSDLHTGQPPLSQQVDMQL